MPDSDKIKDLLQKKQKAKKGKHKEIEETKQRSFALKTIKPPPDPFAEAMKIIESIDFSAAIIAGNYGLFRKIITENSSYLIIYSKLLFDAQSQNTILNRIYELLQTPVDSKYQNKYDIAIATYTIALKQAGLWSLYAASTKAVMIQGKNLHWARYAIADGSHVG